MLLLLQTFLISLKYNLTALLVIMGIPSYFKHVIQEYRSIIRKYDKSLRIDNLYLDSNSIIYDAIRSDSVKGKKDIESAILKEVVDKIAFYIKTIAPKNKVLIAFDGVAPAAKLAQQKTRRYKGQIEKNCHESMGIVTEKLWDTTAITPGTAFMEKLSVFLTKSFNKPSKYGVSEIIVSPPNEPGEGEHKIFEYIRQNKDYHQSSKTAIYGLDADLLMLTLNHLRCADQLYLFRETPHFIKTIDSTLEPEKNYLIDMPAMAKAITSDLNDGNDIKNESQVQRMYDYIFICFFLGNDFLPHFPALNIRTDGITRITSAYKQTLSKVGNIINNQKIVWKNMRYLIKILADNEQEYLQEEHNIRDKQQHAARYGRPGEDPRVQALLNLPITDRKKEIYINPAEDGWEERYYTMLFKSRRCDQLCKDVSLNYLEGLEWTLKYYTTGCPDWRWMYRYDYPPLLTDLLNYVPYFDVEFIAHSDSGPVSSLVQLSYVLPPACFYLLPKKIERTLLKNHSEWYDMSKVNIEYSYCRYFWEGHIESPHINLDELVKAIEVV